MLLLAFSAFAALLSPAHASKQLVFVNALWRHGHRAPIFTFPMDKMKPSEWKEGGTGLGQLTTAGMKMHFTLGKFLRQRYIKSSFLSKHYVASEIYVRSTDYNRTLNSAASNLLGMYSQKENGNRKGVDYPDAAGWPPGVVPIPIHTQPYDEDRIGNPYAHCKRGDAILHLMGNSSEHQAYSQSEEIQSLLANLTKWTGTNPPLTTDNMWRVADALYVEDIYYRDQIDKWYPWYPALREDIRKLNDYSINLLNGIGLKKRQLCGIDTERELKKIHGGTLLNTVREYLSKKLDTIEQRSNDTYMQGLKYFALSAHDTTVTAYLNSLDIPLEKVGFVSFPKYAACVLTELHYDADTKQAFVKMLFFAGNNDTITFKHITKHVAGCKSDMCPFAVYEQYANKYDPGNITTLCNTPLTLSKNCPVYPTSPRSPSRTPPKARPPPSPAVPLSTVPKSKEEQSEQPISSQTAEPVQLGATASSTVKPRPKAKTTTKKPR